MESHQHNIKTSIFNLLATLRLPKEITLDNAKVLELKEQKNHYSLVFVKKLLFRIISKSNQYVLEFPKEYENFLPETGVRTKKWIEIRLVGINEIITLKDNIGKIFTCPPILYPEYNAGLSFF